MFEHEPKRFGESEDRVRRFAARIRKILNGKEGAVNVVMPVDQKQLHLRKVVNEPRFPTILLRPAATPAPDLDHAPDPFVEFAGRNDQEHDQEQEQEGLDEGEVAIRFIRG
jgi:hypothetical protein